MSTDTNGHRPTEQVIDEDKNVDARLKRQIVDLRKEVRVAERLLFVESQANPEVQMSPAERTAAWGTVVKQYIRMIEPLLRADPIEDSKEYYVAAELGNVQLVPPDVDGYKFSLVARAGNVSDSELRRQIGLPRSVDIPQPEVKPFVGLQSIIDAPNVVGHEWAVKVSDGGAPSNADYVYPSTQQVVPKQIYHTAFRKANLFLQKAGVGLDVDDDSMPAIRNFDMSGDEPHAEFDTDKYETPDI